jgi:D-sedoheptulose 7-phosphate isomerase
MKRRIDEHLQVVSGLAASVPLLEAMADAVLACFARGGRLYTIGNGGSAADAQHIAAEMLGRFKLDRPALPAVALTTDSSTLTAVCNDMGGDLIFSRQVEGLVTDNDIVWLLSVSGRSPNIIAAARAARQRGATLIGFTSRKGQALAEYCDFCLMVDHDQSDRVQEAHCLAYHLICERIESVTAHQ